MNNTRKSYTLFSTILIVYAFIIQYLYVGLAIDGLNMLYPVLEAKFGWTREALGVATSVGVYLSVIGLIVAGTLMIKFNVKKILMPVIIILGADIIFMAGTTSFQGFAVAMVILQILVVILQVGSVAMVANWFRKKRGTILGIVTIGPPFSTATFVMIGTRVIETMGHEVFYSAVGIILLILGILGIFILKNKPEDIGLGVDGVPLEASEAGQDEAMAGKSIWTFWAMMKNKEMWLISIGWGLIFLMMTGIMSTAIPRFLDVGIPMNTAVMLWSIAAVMGMPFSYFWGWLDDKAGTPRTCVIFTLCYIIGSVCFLFGSVDRMYLAFGGILSIAMTTGGVPNLQPSIQAWVYGRKEFVSTFRYTSVFHAIFRGTAFAYMGMIFTRTGSYDYAYISFIGVAVLTMVILSMIKKSYDPENGGHKNYPGSGEKGPETAPM